MTHLTLNTGHARHSPRSEVSADALAACRPLLAPGAHPVPGVRLGMTYAEVCRLPGRRRRYVDMVAEADEEQVRLMMHRLGWGVSRRQPVSPGWAVVTYRRRPAARPGGDP